jgi:hypothetical protein
MLVEKRWWQEKRGVRDLHFARDAQKQKPKKPSCKFLCFYSPIAGYRQVAVIFLKLKI